jgi:hypothetical protein
MIENLLSLGVLNLRLKLPFDNTINIVCARGPLSVMAHEVGSGLSKSLNLIRVYVNYNRIKNLLYL